MLRRADHLDIIGMGDSSHIVGRPIVDHDHFEIWVREFPQAFKAIADGTRPIVGADNDRDTRPGQVVRERYIGESGADGCQRRLRAAITAGEAKIPVVDLGATPIPLICPGVHKGARAAGGERSANLPIQCVCLGLLVVPTAVQPQLAHN